MTESLRRIEEQHSTPYEGPSPEWETLLERVRRRIQETPHSRLEALAASFSRAELTAAVDVLAQTASVESTDLGAKAAEVVAAFPSERLLRRAWQHLVHSGSNKWLESATRRIVAALGNQAAKAIGCEEPSRKRVVAWFSEGGLVRNLMKDRDTEQEATDAWLRALPPLKPPLSADSLLIGSLWEMTLTDGSREALEREHVHTLLEVAQRCASETRQRFVVNYISAFAPGEAWAPTIADWFVRQYGEPKRGQLAGAWRRAFERDQKAVEAFLQWLLWRRIDIVLSPDPLNRIAFWRKNFRNKVIGAHVVCAEQAIAMEFRGFVVVEFSNVGNAAYIYPSEELPWLLSIRSSSPAAYKDRSKVVRVGRYGDEARIVHTGHGNWQARAAELIHALLRRFRGGSL